MTTLYQLKTIQGIGDLKAKKILYSLGISPITKIQNLSENKENILNQEITKYKKEESVDKIRRNNINRFIKLNTWRGSRHQFNYPVNGQRTRSNASTVKKLHYVK